MVDQFRSALVNDRERKQITFSSPPKICVNTAPNPYAEASVCNTNGKEKSGHVNIGAEITIFLIWLKASSHSGDHSKWVFYWNNFVRGAISVEKFGRNFLYHPVIPINLTSVGVFGVSNLKIASTLLTSTCKPFSSTL